mgnify:CR=1 FL=1
MVLSLKAKLTKDREQEKMCEKRRAGKHRTQVINAGCEGRRYLGMISTISWMSTTEWAQCNLIDRIFLLIRPSVKMLDC